MKMIRIHGSQRQNLLRHLLQEELKSVLENRADYLEAAYNVDYAVWNVLKNTLGDSLSEVTDLVSDISPYVEKGAEAISNAFTLLDKFKTFVSVGSDNERYEKRLGLQKIKTRFTLLQQMLLTAWNVI